MSLLKIEKKLLDFNAGFSILEIVIALTILSILSYSVLSGVLVSRDYEEYQENRLQLEEIRKAMNSFVQANGFMPCPDTSANPNGVENRAGGGGAGANCQRWWGRLPYQSIGVKPQDVWGNDFYYAINLRADNSGASDINNAARPASFFSTQFQTVFDNTGNQTWVIPRFTMDTGLNPIANDGNLTICGENAVNCNGGTVNAQKLENVNAIAVVVSFGVNGDENWSGSVLDAAETENFDNDRFFWQAPGSNVDGQFFDDQLIWFTGNDVKAAMLSTERGLR